MVAKRTSAFPLKVALTEANLDASSTIPSTDPDSYLRGQWWCDFMNICLSENVSIINFWSSSETSFGAMQTNGTKRSTYYHYQMMANSFLATPTNPSTFYTNSTPSTNHKAFAYKNVNANEIGVLVMNQDLTTTTPWLFDEDVTINLNNTATGAAINVSLATGVNGSYSCRIKTETSALIKFNATTGAFISRTEYCVDDAVNNLPPKTWTNSANAYIADGNQWGTPDTGIEPYYGNAWDLPFSDDIWCRNWDSGTGMYDDYASGGVYTGTQAHQSPDWTSNSSKTPRFFVGLHIPCGPPVSGTIELYQKISTTADVWLTNWSLIGTAPVTGANPGTYTVQIDWPNMGSGGVGSVPDPGTGSGQDYCLVARFVSSTDPMFWERLDPTPGSTAGDNVKYNNNIAQRNVTFVNGPNNNFMLYVGNATSLPAHISFNFVTPTFPPDAPPFTNVGTINLDLGQVLYNKWVLGGSVGTNVIPSKRKLPHDNSVSPYSIYITGPNASIGNIQLGPNEIYKTIITFNYSAPNPNGAKYTFDVREFNNGQFSGAVRYFITPSNCQVVDAGANVTIGRNCSATLSAIPSVDNAIYNWYNNATGAPIGRGQTISVSPHVTTTYEVQMKTPDGCITYDVVTITVDPKRTCRIIQCPVIDFKNKILHQPEIIKNREVVINGYLRVPAGVTLRIENSKLNFQKDASLEIMPGGRLEIIVGELRGCDPFDKWKGISVLGTNIDNLQVKISGSSISDAISPLSTQMVTGLSLENSTIEYGTNGIELVNSKNFTIRGNNFYGQDIAIKTSGTFVGTGSIIEKNYFAGNMTALNFNNDNHSQLVIKCDTFETYTDYAIYSNNSTLQDQGTLTEGAGNVFISSSVQANNKLRHNGNTMKYYYDPSNPISLTTGTGMTATAQAATTDAACIAATTSARLGNGSADNSVEAAVTRSKEIEFKAYPNPFNDQLTILYNLPANCKGGSIKIYEAASGKEVVSSVLIAGENKLVLENINIAPGMYLCRILTDNGTSKQFKLVNIK